MIAGEKALYERKYLVISSIAIRKKRTLKSSVRGTPFLTVRRVEVASIKILLWRKFALW